jgi:phosphate starvation-inducible PhoH-like protein
MELSMRKDKKIKETFIYNPKSTNQDKYVEYLNDDKIDMIIAAGPAGTGKTLFACLKAISQLKNGEIKKLVVTRPVVTVEEDIGFLPGNIVKKMDPWTRPIFDLFLEFFSKTELDNFIYNNIIEISPLAFMRGRTFKNSFIIADEMQNSSPNQMKMLTTRIGVNSKMVITGDLNQTDILVTNGLHDLIERVNNYNSKTNNSLHAIKIVKFEKRDIERSEIVKSIIDIYECDNKNIPTNNIIRNTNKNTTTVIPENTTNTTNTTITQSNKIDNNYKYNYHNDAALIPKRDIMKNTDIFFENSNF